MWWLFLARFKETAVHAGVGRSSYGGYKLALPKSATARNVDAVDNRTEIRDFLATRRAKLTPAQVGLPTAGRRRVPGLRREEVAVLAGVSPDWYNRLEKGHISGVSDDVLDAVARALQLSDAEREHLFNLARAARPIRTPRRRARPQIPPSIQRVLDSMTGTAAFVRNGRLDILASNALARALYSPVLDQPAHRGNIARFDFLDPRAADYYPDHDGALAVAVALLRTEAGRNPHDKDLTDLVGELATRSEAFRTRWGAHDVRLHRGGIKTFNHPVVGYMDLAYDSMELVAAPGLILTAYTAEPVSPSADNLALLASWAATEATSAAPLDHTSPQPDAADTTSTD
jgi:transcriptional regulator with XRE-family HTH domain